MLVYLYQDAAEAVYLSDGRLFWRAPAVTRAMHGQFAGDALAWMAGSWLPDTDGAMQAAEPGAGLLLTAMADATGAVTVARSAAECPAAHLYLSGLVQADDIECGMQDEEARP